jgi:hypothetical protein
MRRFSIGFQWLPEVTSQASPSSATLPKTQLESLSPRPPLSTTVSSTCIAEASESWFFHVDQSKRSRASCSS